MTHLRILMRARRRGILNRVGAQSSLNWAVLVAVLAVLVGGLLLLGHAAAPGLLRPPMDLVTAIGMNTTDGKLPAGAAALEAAFWLAALASSVLNFRVMELLFRRKDVRALEHFPLKLYALYIDRLLAALGEAVAASLVLAPFFIPMFWHGGALAAGTSIALIVVGLLTSSAIGFAVQLGAGASLAPTQAADPNQSRAERPNTASGSAQVFLYAPGVALAGSVIIILLAKLALGEVIKAGEPTRALGVGLGVLGVGFAIALAMSFNYFVRAFPRMSARFHEVDFIGYSVSAEHQTSDFLKPRLGEALLPTSARSVYRSYALQFGRRYMLARWSYGLGWLASGIALFRLSEAALPLWLVVTLPAIAAATLVNPWVRLSSKRIRPSYQNLLALDKNADTQAAIAFGLRELLLFAGPYALLALVALGLRSGDWATALGLAALSLGGCLAINGAMALIWSTVGRHRLAELIGPILLAIVMLAAANISLLALAAMEALLIAGHLRLLLAKAPAATPSAPHPQGG
ncbi:hypothetical protein [Bradymonas sediminis]|uniref:Uncharacterized protein n=1 Tax=Bradymonas sediminis TaxID=1548548 RepID=A0A2Z4FJJ4_9DELT|nr:hypothetical protein [Bradymonas sediminis]AWV89181.1 hypothetical protein DN745_07445 [Bradymonas sediminis]TDP64352.1 hypothetical protein DFR33_10913 [Bradymonas sediminis]